MGINFDTDTPTPINKFKLNIPEGKIGIVDFRGKSFSDVEVFLSKLQKYNKDYRVTQYDGTAYKTNTERFEDNKVFLFLYRTGKKEILHGLCDISTAKVQHYWFDFRPFSDLSGAISFAKDRQMM